MAPNRKLSRRPLAAEDPDQLLHPERVCATLGFCYRTFRRYVEDGLIPVVRIRRADSGCAPTSSLSSAGTAWR